MLIAKRSPISGITRTRELPITEEEIARWQGGELIQNVWPHLSDSDREFIMTGIIDEEWDIFEPLEEHDVFHLPFFWRSLTQSTEDV